MGDPTTKNPILDSALISLAGQPARVPLKLTDDRSVPADDMDGAEGQRVLYPTHQVANEYMATRVATWFHTEYVGKRAWMALLSGDGTWFYWNKTYAMGIPPYEKREYARRICAYINRHCHHDGVWICGWLSDHWETFYLLWKDADGDIHVPIETHGWQAGWEALRDKWTDEDWGNHCDAAWQIWYDAIQSLELKEGQSVKFAQGQPFTPVH